MAPACGFCFFFFFSLSLSPFLLLCLSSPALLDCCLWFKWQGFIWAVVRVIGMVKSPSGRCSLACQGKVASWWQGMAAYGDKGEQRGAWDNLGRILGKRLVEAVIHHPGCAQDSIHGILSIFTPWTKLAHLRTVARKSFSLDFLGRWENNF